MLSIENNYQFFARSEKIPFFDINSSYVPSSLMIPSSKTIILFEFLIVLIQWAIVTLVEFLQTSSMAFYTSCSLLESRALVASSNKNINGFLIKHRAILIHYFYPPDSFSPLFPTSLLNPSSY